MKRVEAIIDGIPIYLNVPETNEEFKEGARASNGVLSDNEGYLFDFRSPMPIVMENSGVSHDLTLLYLFSLDKYGAVAEVSQMKEQASTPVASVGVYRVCIELRKDFCDRNRIGVNSIVSLKKSLWNKTY